MERIKAAWKILTGQTPVPPESPSSQPQAPTPTIPERTIIKPPSPPKKPTMSEDDEAWMDEYRGTRPTQQKRESTVFLSTGAIDTRMLTQRNQQIQNVKVPQNVKREESIQDEHISDEEDRRRNKIHDEEIGRQLGKMQLSKGWDSEESRIASISSWQKKLLEEEDAQIRSGKFPMYSKDEEDQIVRARKSCQVPLDQKRRLNFPTPKEKEEQKMKDRQEQDQRDAAFEASQKAREIQKPQENIQSLAHETIKKLLDFRTAFIPTEVLFKGNKIVPIVVELKGYEVEKINIRNGIFVRAHKYKEGPGDLRRCQDAGAIACTDKGDVKSFALADGVGSFVASGETASLAVAHAVRILQKKRPQDNPEHFCKNTGQKVEEQMRQDYQNILQPAWKNYIEQHSMSSRLAQKKIKWPSGSTTLISGFIEKNVLYLSRVGDGGFMVVGKDGKIKITSKEPETPPGQPYQLILAGTKPLKKMGEDYSISLVEGDLVLINSDGLFHEGGGMTGTLTEANRASQVSQMRKRGDTVEQIAFGLLNDALGGDDNSILAFEYVAEKE